MKISVPWWINPWHEVQKQKRLHTLHAKRCAQLREAQQDNITRLAGENSRLQRELQLASLPPLGGAMSTATPEFVFIGIPKPDGNKRLWASKDLAGTAFSMAGGPMDPGPPKWKIGAVMANSLTVDGMNYGECIERVLQIWANWLSVAPALAPPPAKPEGPFAGIEVQADRSLPPGTAKIVSGREERIVELPWNKPDGDGG